MTSSQPPENIDSSLHVDLECPTEEEEVDVWYISSWEKLGRGGKAIWIQILKCTYQPIHFFWMNSFSMRVSYVYKCVSVNVNKWVKEILYNSFDVQHAQPAVVCSSVGQTQHTLLAKWAYHKCWRVRVRFPSGTLYLSFNMWYRLAGRLLWVFCGYSGVLQYLQNKIWIQNL